MPLKGLFASENSASNTNLSDWDNKRHILTIIDTIYLCQKSMFQYKNK